MLETKDSAIKLFGKTIPVKEILVGLSSLSSAHVVVDDHNHDSSTNSSRESRNSIEKVEF